MARRTQRGTRRQRPRCSARWPAPATIGVVLALGLTGSDARAFCRTRTERVPADYDATTAGCKLEGVPLFWQNSCIGYSIQGTGSRKIAYAEAAEGISQAFTRWTGATCPADAAGRTRPSIDVRDLGPVDCAKVEYVSGAPNQNVIVFRDEAWPHPPTVLGLVTTRFNPTTGELYGADMELNTFGMNPLAVRDPVGPADYDFLSIATHEAGHFLGLNHSDVEQSTMFARYRPGQTAQRNLRRDDIEGICSIYRPDGVRTVLDKQVLAGGQCDPTPRGGYSTQCADAGCGSAPSRARPSWVAAATLALAFTALVRRRRRGSSAR